MKKLALLLAGLLLSGITVKASPNDSKSIETVEAASNYVRGYGKNFIFIEGGIEFSVFPDGQFDFNMSRHHSNFNVSVNAPGASVSYNSGYDYNSYVQYDEYGAVVQIESIPVFYDHYGRISQAGDIFISYNDFGYVNRVGGLYVNYNRFNRFSHCTGFINVYNRAYVYRPWHSYYAIPAYNYCVVYNRPYRQYYRPIRYHYSRPYNNNFRRRSAVASRRGNTIRRDSRFASRTDGRRRATYNKSPRKERNTLANNGERRSSIRANSITTTRPNRGITRGATRTNATTGPTRGIKVRNNTARPTRPALQNTRPTRPVSQNSKPNRSKPQIRKYSNKSKSALGKTRSSQNRIVSGSGVSNRSFRSSSAPRTSQSRTTQRSINRGSRGRLGI